MHERKPALDLEQVEKEVADCLIAQACIDNDVPLITFDRDFRHFTPAGLILLTRIS